MMSNSFKIIALKPLDDCSEEHLKVLARDTIYYFYQDYTISEKNECETISYKESYPADLFDKGGLSINISAIVGGNGSGKSTVVDLLFKAMNNIAFSIKENGIGKRKTILHDIIAVEGIHLDFYIEKGERTFKIKISNTDFKVYEFIGNKNYKTIESEEIKNFKLSDLFYTEVINYSHYACNSNIEGEWIEKLFHKNDSYQTPVVFNPYRKAGNIDINTENYLVKQRLIANLLYPADEDFDFRKIGENLIAEEIILTLKPEKTNTEYPDKAYIHEHFDFNEEDKKIILAEAYTVFFGEDINLNKLKTASDNFTSIKSNMTFKSIESYVVYKLISIAYKYPEYKVFFNQTKAEFKQNIIPYLKKLKDDNSHITFKLRQTLNYLHYYKAPFKSRNSIKELSKNISVITSGQKTNVTELIPPPIFDLEILLKSTHDNDRDTSIQFSLLSSGEKQFIYSINSILYHLRNLDSVSDNKIRYTSVNIVFEEIELYFHPNLQRKLIHALLKSIERIHLKNIKSINIIFITHSPFILSDIPSGNVMFLYVQDGKAVQEKEKEKRKTFGANIHELLNSNFFFNDDVYIGEFSKHKIEEIIKEIDDAEKGEKINEQRTEEINNLISIIDEKIVRTKLREMLFNVSEDGTNWIDKEIKFLNSLRDE